MNKAFTTEFKLEVAKKVFLTAEQDTTLDSIFVLIQIFIVDTEMRPNKFILSIKRWRGGATEQRNSRALERRSDVTIN